MAEQLGSLTLGGPGYTPARPARTWTLTVSASQDRRGCVRVRARVEGRDYAEDRREFDVYSADLALALALAGREIAIRERAGLV